MGVSSVQMLLLKLSAIPDITLPKYQYLDEGNADGILQKQTEFLRIMQIILKLRNVSAHLIYTYRPELAKGEKLGVYLMFGAESAETLKMIGGLLPGMTISEYFRFRACSAKQEFGATFYTGAATVIKREKCISFIRQKTGVEFPFYSVAEWTPNESARMVDMMRMLQSIGEMTRKPCAIRMDLFAVDAAERFSEAMRPFLKHIAELQYGSENVRLSAAPQASEKIDESVRNVQRTYEKWISVLPSYTT